MSDHLKWRTSSYSDSEGSNCMEVASSPRIIHVRDSKLGPTGSWFRVRGSAWAASLAHAAGDGAGCGGLRNAG
ncbi:DUF397 domain-containing protein [Streptomyces sp. NPDC047000]|uniref:DUF397 domain-containing protein n=1 Tax=Streptomyces sp. NPDC047000 TaxID=3155474 RepID=UPI0033DF5417